MFLRFWIIFLTSGVIMAVLALTWALKSKQFEDQDRARFLPLVGLTAEELAQSPPRKKIEIIGIMAVMSLSLVALVSSAVVIFRCI